MRSIDMMPAVESDKVRKGLVAKLTPGSEELHEDIARFGVHIESVLCKDERVCRRTYDGGREQEENDN